MLLLLYFGRTLELQAVLVHEVGYPSTVRLHKLTAIVLVLTGVETTVNNYTINTIEFNNKGKRWRIS